jgi:hypothetical protein
LWPIRNQCYNWQATGKYSGEARVVVPIDGRSANENVVTFKLNTFPGRRNSCLIFPYPQKIT